MSYAVLQYIVYNTRGISLKVFRVDRIMEGALGVQVYSNSVNPGPHIWRYCDPGLAYSAFQNSVNPENFQRYASSTYVLSLHLLKSIKTVLFYDPHTYKVLFNIT